LWLFPFSRCARHSLFGAARRANHGVSRKVWGVIWLIIAFIFFILGILVGIVAFKVRHPPALYLLRAYSERRVIAPLMLLFVFVFVLLWLQESTAEQKKDAEHFLPVPGSKNAAATAWPMSAPLALLVGTLSSALLGLL
jgi:uncharacterized BrkB/YihY/UPF0761 family membrane protein